MEDILLVFVWQCGSCMGLSPMCFSTNKIEEAYDLYISRISSGFMPPIILKDLLDIYANTDQAEKLRGMFRTLQENDTDERLVTLKEYVLNRWLK